MEPGVLKAPVIVALLNCLSGAMAEMLMMYTYSGSIGAGNYTYLELYHRNHIHVMYRGTSSRWMDIFAASYLRLQKHQVITLELHSLRGDADLYVNYGSNGNANPELGSSPTYLNYKVQAVSCGVDSVMVTYDMDSPVHIGIYGHPSQETSRYELHFILKDSPYEPYEYHLYSFSQKETRSSQTFQSAQKPSHGQKQPFSDAKHNNEESIIWTIFVNVLKIILDILM